MEEKYKEIDSKLEEALRNPISYEKLKKMDIDLKIYERAGVTEKSEIKYFQELSKSKIELLTLLDFRYVLNKLGYPQEHITNVIKHENAHVNVAESLGAEFRGYNIVIYNDHGMLGTRIWGISVLSKDWSEEETKENKIKIFQAPEVYENMALSPGDIKVLKNLKKK